MAQREHRHEWFCGAFKRTGAMKYTHMIRGPYDPERSSREARKGQTLAWRDKIKATSAKEWEAKLLEYLADGEPRTVNRMAVELLDQTADVCAPPLVDALWALHAACKIECTNQAPIYFRVKGSKREPAGKPGQMPRTTPPSKGIYAAVAPLRDYDLSGPGAARVAAVARMVKQLADGCEPDDDNEILLKRAKATGKKLEEAWQQLRPEELPAGAEELRRLDGKCNGATFNYVMALRNHLMIDLESLRDSLMAPSHEDLDVGDEIERSALDDFGGSDAEDVAPARARAPRGAKALTNIAAAAQAIQAEHGVPHELAMEVARDVAATLRGKPTTEAIIARTSEMLSQQEDGDAPADPTDYLARIKKAKTADQGRRALHDLHEELSRISIAVLKDRNPPGEVFISMSPRDQKHLAKIQRPILENFFAKATARSPAMGARVRELYAQRRAMQPFWETLYKAEVAAR